MGTQARSSPCLLFALSLMIGTFQASSAHAPGTVAWSDVLDQPRRWYGTKDAVAIADIVLQWQRPSGGWPKDIDMTVAPAPGATGATVEPDSTIDNGATVTQIRLLDRMFGATADPRYKDAAMRGIEYLFAAQYPNGGWPQVYPLRHDYSRRITFNDDAMTNVLSLLEDMGNDRALSFAGDARRRQARHAIDVATTLILRAQVRIVGRLTAWCAQHDEVTLEPRPARPYEHISLSGRESVEVVRFLMRRPPRPDLVRAIDAAVDWLRRVALRGVRIERLPDPALPHGHDLRLRRDAAAPLLWARFYEIGTNKPIYSGRDGVVRYSITEIDVERRTGYAWVGTWPARLLDVDYQRWRARLSASPVR